MNHYSLKSASTLASTGERPHAASTHPPHASALPHNATHQIRQFSEEDVEHVYTMCADVCKSASGGQGGPLLDLNLTV